MSRGPKLSNPQGRFWPHVQKVWVDGVDSKMGQCWVWTGKNTNQGGYGMFSIKEGDSWKSRYVHRLAYEWLVGPIPEGLDLDHLCEVRRCVNPDHLRPCTRRENVNRKQQSHCKHGHALEGDNLVIRVVVRRECRACVNRRARERV